MTRPDDPGLEGLPARIPVCTRRGGRSPFERGSQGAPEQGGQQGRRPSFL